MNRLEAALFQLARAETMMARADLATERLAAFCISLSERRQPRVQAEILLYEMRVGNGRMETFRNLILDRIELIRSSRMPLPQAETLPRLYPSRPLTNESGARVPIRKVTEIHQDLMHIPGRED